MKTNNKSFDLLDYTSWDEIPENVKMQLGEKLSPAEFERLLLTQKRLEHALKNEALPKAPAEIYGRVMANLPKPQSTITVYRMIQVVSAVAASLILGFWLSSSTFSTKDTLSTGLADTVRNVQDVSISMVYDTIDLAKQSFDAQEELVRSIESFEGSMPGKSLRQLENYEAIADATSLVSTRSLLTRMQLAANQNFNQDTVAPKSHNL